MEQFEDPENAAAAIIRWAENRSAGKVAVLKRQLAARDSEVERLSREVIAVARSVRAVTRRYEDFRYLMSREAI